MLWETVCLFLALAISDWLLPRTPLHLRACRLPAIWIEIHYNMGTYEDVAKHTTSFKINCTVVHHSCPPTGSPKIARKAPKSWTGGHPVAPWQCLCPCHPFDNGFSEGGLLCSCWPILLTVQTWHPGDFFLFPTLKARLRGKQFSTLEDAVAA